LPLALLFNLAQLIPDKPEKTYPVERGKDYNGFYICQSVQFVGNNAGGPFECRLETIELPNAT
jgi:hypothetical protein